MRAHTMQARVLHRLLHLLRVVAEEASGFNLLEAKRGDLVKGSIVIFRQNVAHGVKLQPQR